MSTYICPKMAREYFSYSKETGELTKIKGKSKGKKVGWVFTCGTKTRKKEYIRISTNGFVMRAHRLIWVLVTGEQPDTIDHIDGNGLNNRWDNLRSVSILENTHNSKKLRNNTSGTTGVYWDKKLKKYKAIIGSNKNQIYLGLFDDIKEAIKVRKDAEIKYNYHPNHGK